MSDLPISGLTAQTGAGVADNDLMEQVDVSDTSQAPTGTNKKIPVSEVVIAIKNRLALVLGSDVPFKMTDISSAQSPYTLVAGEIAAVNATGGAVTVNYPASPVDGAVNGVILAVGGNVVTVNAGGSNRFNAPGGATAKTMTETGQSLLSVYESHLLVHEVLIEPQLSVTGGYATTPNTSQTGKLAFDVLFDVQEFGSTTGSGSFTWTVPSWVQPNSKVRVEVVGGGGAGGTGRRGAAGTLRVGGGGGQAGFRSWAEFLIKDLPSPTVAVTVGAGGIGTTGIGTDDTDGANGSAGGLSSFGKFVVASGGAGGFGGTSVTGSGQGGTTLVGARGTVAGSPGCRGSDTTTFNPESAPEAGTFAAGQLTANQLNGGGGGGGAGINASNGNVVGCDGQDVNGYTDGSTAGGGAGAGSLGGTGGSTADPFQGSGGGGGGRANGADAVGGGGPGGFPGGGGGGGGAALNGFTGGKGGDGRNGFVRVTVWP